MVQIWRSIWVRIPDRLRVMVSSEHHDHMREKADKCMAVCITSYSRLNRYEHPPHPIAPSPYRRTQPTHATLESHTPPHQAAHALLMLLEQPEVLLLLF